MNRSNIMTLIKSIHKKTPGTGMKDDVPAVIKGKKVCKACGGKISKYADGGPLMGDGGEQGDQPAALSEGEYVIPADVVSMLGDGNTDAGVKILDNMIKQIRMSKGKHLAKGKQAPSLT